MPYRFHRQVSVCLIANQAVFLDADRDRYFSVGGVAAKAVRALLESRSAHEEELERLAKAGLLEVGEGPQPPLPRQSTTPSRSLVEEAAGQPARGGGVWLEVAASLVQAHRDVRRHPFASILDDLGSGRADHRGICVRSHDPRLKVAAAYNAARRLVPTRPLCLPDSLALLACLARRGLAADLVFGVKLHPFSAHCWVQAGDIVLNDALDHVTIHTPILVV